MERGEVVQIVRQVLDDNFFPTRKSNATITVADLIVKRLEEAEVLSVTKGGLTPEELMRAAYGAAHELIRQAIENGELVTAEIDEFLPSGYEMQDSDWNDLQAAIEGTVMSDLWEEQAKRDG